MAAILLYILQKNTTLTKVAHIYWRSVTTEIVGLQALSGTSVISILQSCHVGITNDRKLESRKVG
jgi:hypothetical protein